MAIDIKAEQISSPSTLVNKNILNRAKELLRLTPYQQIEDNIQKRTAIVNQAIKTRKSWALEDRGINEIRKVREEIVKQKKASQITDIEAKELEIRLITSINFPTEKQKTINDEITSVFTKISSRLGITNAKDRIDGDFQLGNLTEGQRYNLLHELDNRANELFDIPPRNKLMKIAND